MKACIAVVFFAPVVAFAAGVTVNEPLSQNAITPVEDPHVRQYFYGELNNYPHTFQFSVKEDMHLFVKTDVPYASQHDHSIIVIKEERRGVSEVGRITYNEGTWQKEFDWLLGRSFRSQGALEAELSSGVYRVEVSSPENFGKYRLTIGTEQHTGLFSAYKTAVVGAYFFGGFFAIFFTPLMFVTLLVVGVVLYWRYRKYTQKHA